jgi:tetratricopeptide (TPR) repeat protein
MKKSVQHILFCVLALFCIVFIYIAFSVMDCNNDTDYSQHYLNNGNSYFDTGNYEKAKTQYLAYMLYSEWDGSQKQRLAENCIVLLKEAEQYFSEKNYESAKRKYQEVIRINSQDPNVPQKITTCNQYICTALSREARKYFSDKNYESAKRKYQEISHINPEYPNITRLVEDCDKQQCLSLQRKAESHFANEEYESAKTEFQRILWINPNYSNIAQRISACEKLIITGRVEKVWVDHNIYQNGYKGMKIHVKFTVYNMLGKTGNCVAYFEYSNGTNLRDYNGSYRTKSGTVSTSTSFTPNYENCIYENLVVFIPYSELHLSSGGTHSLRFKVEIHSSRKKYYITQSEYTYFTYQ